MYYKTYIYYNNDKNDLMEYVIKYSFAFVLEISFLDREFDHLGYVRAYRQLAPRA